MADHAGAVDQGDECKPANSLDVLMKLSLQLPRIRYWLWWFPVQELRNPLVFYLEAWLADSIFGTDQTIIPDIVWMNQVLLTMDIVNNGNFVKITIYGQPRVQNRMKSMLLSLVSRRRQHRARAQKMKWLEEFLKACSSEIQTVQHTVA